MWYDPNKTLSYNCLFNFAIGGRGVGKTYGWTNKVIKEFKKDAKDRAQFMYVRRYDTEFEHIGEFFQAVKGNFPDDVLEVKGRNFLINDEEAGYAVSLTTSRKLKSTSFPFVKYIIFDEFIIDKGTYHYLKDEVNIFLDLYETVARTRNNVIAIFLSNALTVVNPYFIRFKIRPRENAEFTVFRDKDMLIQMIQDSEFTEMKKNTRFGKIIANDKYGEYSIDNKFMLDNYDFIERKTGTARYYFTFIYNGTQYGVWLDSRQGKFFVSNDVDPFNQMVYCFTLDDHSPNTMLFKSINRSSLLKNFIDNFKLGNVRFEDLRIKKDCYEILGMTLL